MENMKYMTQEEIITGFEDYWWKAATMEWVMKAKWMRVALLDGSLRQ